MAKTKKISVNAFQKAMKETYNPVCTFDWNGIEVTVKRTLSLEEMMLFVDEVTKSCFAQITNTYLPEIKDFAIRVCVLEKYANFTMPQNAVSQYELVYCTDAVNKVLSYVNLEQFNTIKLAIDTKIDNIAQLNIESLHMQMNEFLNNFGNLQDKLAGLFTDINVEEITNLAKTLSNGGLDNNNLVEAYINSTKKS